MDKPFMLQFELLHFVPCDLSNHSGLAKWSFLFGATMGKAFRNAGIYIIENNINHHSYIGKSIDTWERWEQHRASLKNGKHYNTHLQRSWNKHGEENFSFRVLEFCSVEELDEKEQLWIVRLNPEYNLIRFTDNKEWVWKEDKLIEKMEKRDLDQGHHFFRPAWHKYVYGGLKRNE